MYLLAGVSGNLVEGNYIGTNAAGTAALPNIDGVSVNGPGNTIGGTAAGAGNLISGNSYGVFITGRNNQLLGNLIGTDTTGTRFLGNFDGIDLYAPNNTIGGTTAAARNLISGNRNDGVYILPGITGNLVAGNYIGTDAAGTTALGNGDNAVTLDGTANTVGPGNLINGAVVLSGTGNQVLGNLLGTDATGTVALRNAQGVVLVYASNNTVGGAGGSAGNVLVSSSGGAGLYVAASVSGTLIQGNKIGTDITGTAALGAYASDLDVEGSGNTIGGTAAGAGNLIAGLGPYTGYIDYADVYINGVGNQVLGNQIGTDITGTLALAGGYGIKVVGDGNTVGGTAFGAGNLISGRDIRDFQPAEVYLLGNNNQVLGNYVGTDVSGTAALGNGYGVLVGGSGNTVGGAATGAGNLISGNTGDGVRLTGNNNQVLGNTIGTNAARTARLANANGVSITGANNTVGGAGGALNVIAANLDDGVLLGAGATGNLLQNNVLGRNNLNGVEIVAGANGNTLLHNAIGTTPSGSLAIPNGMNGVRIASNNNTVGGTAAGAGNLIDLSPLDGLLIAGGSGNLVQGNFIGTDYTGTLALGNAQNGVELGSASGNTVGGTVAGAGNTIVNSGNDGVLVRSGAHNPVRQNSIFNSGNLGIELVAFGNNNQPAPTLTSATSDGTSTTTIQGTLANSMGLAAYALDFFADPVCNPSGYGEGKVFLGTATVTTDGFGRATFTATFNVGVPPGLFVSATATDPSGNTSVFAACLSVTSSMDGGGADPAVVPPGPAASDPPAPAPTNTRSPVPPSPAAALPPEGGADLAPGTPDASATPSAAAPVGPHAPAADGLDALGPADLAPELPTTLAADVPFSTLK